MVRRLVTLALLLALAGGTTYIFAQSENKAGSSPKKPATADAAAEGDKKEASDPFAVPPGNDSKVLSLFLQRLARTPPEDRSNEGISAHLSKLDAAVKEVMSRDIEEELFVNAAEIRFQVFTLLSRFGDKDADAKREKLLEELKKDKRGGVQQLAERMELTDRVSRLPVLSNEEKQKLIQDLAARLKEGTVEEPEQLQSAIELAMQTATLLERTEDTKNAIAAYQLFSKELVAKHDDRLASLIERMDATVRRLSLPGNKMDVAGTTVTGENFNITQYGGKVVLVDFWATWCGPCRAELPNVKRLYKAYHEKGFEVVGISLDEDAETLDEFLDKEKIEWITLFPAKEEERGWENPIAQHYGITGIPTAILVNQEGKVVSLMARGEELAMQLEKLLGPIEKSEKTAE